MNYILNTKLKAKLKRINKHLNKFGGRDLTEKEAIRFNIDHNSQSGFEAGSQAFYLSNAPDEYNGLSWHKASSRYYHWIGDALIDISEQVTSVPYDCYDKKIEHILEDSIYKQ